MTSFHSTSPFRTSFSKQDPSSSNSSFKSKLNLNFNDAETSSKLTLETNSELNLKVILDDTENLSMNQVLATSYVTSSQMQGHFPFTNDIALGYEPSSLYPLNSTLLHEVEIEENENEARESVLHYEPQSSVQDPKECHSDITQDSLGFSSPTEPWKKRFPLTFSPSLVSKHPNSRLNSLHLTPILSNGQDVEGVPFSTPLLDVRPPMPLLNSPEGPFPQTFSARECVHSRSNFPANAPIPLFPTAFGPASKESATIEPAPPSASPSSDASFPRSFLSPSPPSPPSPFSPLQSFLPLSIIQEEPTYFSSFLPASHHPNFSSTCSSPSKNGYFEPSSMFPHSTSFSPKNDAPSVAENLNNPPTNLNFPILNSSSPSRSSILASLPSLALKDTLSIEHNTQHKNPSPLYPPSTDLPRPSSNPSFLKNSQHPRKSASHFDTKSSSHPVLSSSPASHSSPTKSMAPLLSEPLHGSSMYTSLTPSLPLKSPYKKLSHQPIYSNSNQVPQNNGEKDSNLNLQSPLMLPSIFNLPTIEDTLFFHKQDLHHQLSEPVPDTPLDEVIEHLQRHLNWTSTSPSSSLLSSPLLSPLPTSPTMSLSDSHPPLLEFQSNPIPPPEPSNKAVSVSLSSPNVSFDPCFSPTSQAFQDPRIHSSTFKKKESSPLSVQPSFIEWERLLRPPDEPPSQLNLPFPSSPQPKVSPRLLETKDTKKEKNEEVKLNESRKTTSLSDLEHQKPMPSSFHAAPLASDDVALNLKAMDSNLKQALQAYPTPLSTTLSALTTLNLSHCHLTSCLGLSDATPHLVSCDLSHNELTYLTGLPTTLLELNVSFNQLSNFTCFTPLIHLQSLDASFNFLDEELGLNFFVGLNHLHTLYLNSVGHWHRLSTCPSLPSLTHFSFTHNQCTLVQLDPIKLPNLVDLDLSHNELPALTICPPEEHVALLKLDTVPPLDPSLALFSKLKTLKLSSNAFTTFPYSHPTLTSLDLSDNLISVFPMDAFPNLNHCNLEKNQLSQLSTKLRTMGLEILDLSYQSITSFQPSPTSSISDIHSSHTSFSPSMSLPTSASLSLSSVAFTFPRSLILKCNSLDWSSLTLPFFSVLKLDLSYCNLTILPISFASFFPSLTYFSVSHNPLSSLPTLTSLPFLTHFMASSTKLSDLSLILSQLPTLTLTHLDLRCTPLTSLFYPNLPNPKDVPLDQVFLNSLSDSIFVQRLMHRCSVTVHCTSLVELDQLPVDRPLYLHYQTVMEKFMKSMEGSSSSFLSSTNVNSSTPFITLMDKK